MDVPRPVLDRLLSDELDLSSALLRGRIRVGGDTGLAARLVNVFNPPPVHPPSLPTPNTYVGLSDHPLDRKAINLTNVIVDGARQRLAYMIEEYQAEIVLSETWPVPLGYSSWIEEVWANYPLFGPLTAWLIRGIIYKVVYRSQISKP